MTTDPIPPLRRGIIRRMIAAGAVAADSAMACVFEVRNRSKSN